MAHFGRVVWGKPEMGQHPFLDDLTPEQHGLLEPLLEPVQLPARTAICRQGGPADFIYLLLAGNVSLRYKPYDGPRITLTHLHGGDVFGWSSVIGNVAYTSDAVSTSAVTVIRIRGDALRGVCTRHAETGQEILEKLAEAVAPRWMNSQSQVRSILGRGVLVHG